MPQIRQQSGEGKLGCIIWAALLAAVVLIGWKAIPVKIKNAELYDFMVEQSKWAGSTPSEEIKKRIYDQAMYLELPLEKKNIVVTKTAGRVQMSVSYTVPLEFPGFTYEWQVNHEVDKPFFVF